MPVPKLRFKDENGKEYPEWKQTDLNNIALIYDGVHQTPHYVESGVPFVSVENINNLSKPKKYITKSDYEKDYKVFAQKNDIFMTRIGDIGTSALVPFDDIAYYVSLALIKVKKEVSSIWLNQYIKCPLFQKELYKRSLQYAFPQKINKGEIGKCMVYLPSLPEQEKIADFLSSYDRMIDIQSQRVEAMKTRKKGLLHKIFSQEIRFKGDQGQNYPEWKKERLKKFTEKVKRKAPLNSEAPVMMISADSGFIYQKDRYSRNNAGTSLKNYTLLKQGEFAYNHGYSKTRTYGSVFWMKLPEARVPYVYHSFKLKEGCIPFWGYYLNSGLLDRSLKRLVTSSARMDGLLNISYESYMSINVNVPSLPEQQKIADFLSAVDAQIEVEEKRLETMKTIKKGLLQQMFI